jgi:hypothetical protein
MGIFGAITNPQDLPRAVEGHLKKWLDTDLAAIEREAGYTPPHYSRPASYLKVNLLEGIPGEESSPAIIIVSRGANGKPEKSARTGTRPYPTSTISLGMDVGIAVMTSSFEGDGAREVAGAYCWAIAAAMLHRRDLDGRMDGKLHVESLDDLRLDDLPGEEARTRAMLRLEFTIRVNNFIDLGSGPSTPDPPTDPYPAPGNLPTVATHTETISKEQPT